MNLFNLYATFFRLFTLSLFVLHDKQLVLHDGSGSGSCRTLFDDGALLLLGRWRGAAVVLLVHGGGGTGSGRPSAGAGLVVLRRSMLATAMATGLSGR